MGKKKAEQNPLPGMEARDVPEIEQAAENYRKIRDERCELSKRESEAKSALIQVMKNLGRSFYNYNGLRVQLEITDNVKVRASEDGDEEPAGTFTQPRRRRSAEEVVGEWIEQAEEMIEQQQQAEIEEEAERERLHREAVATWRRDRPASDEAEKEEDYQEEWFAALTAEEREKYHTAPCKCGHSRDWHGEEDKDTCERECGACANLSLCSQYHCPACDTKGGHQATCEYYVLGEGTPVQDNFTAPRCECGRIDGGHTPECPKSNALRFEDYLAYARAHYKSNYQSHARKMELSKLKDEEVRAWKQQQAGNGVEAEAEPKKKKREKLSPVEAAIDR